jgi:serine kinase of HPr protein (carbohydrate metabolism regulator)
VTPSGVGRRAGESGIHACAVAVGERGALIRGPSGAGKSALSLALLALARQTGRFAALVGDDRIFLSVAAERLLARGVPGFEGVIERRSEGLLIETHEARVVIRLVVDLGERGDAPPRWPGDQDLRTELLGVRLPRLAIDSTHGPLDGAYAALRRLAKVP